MPYTLIYVNQQQVDILESVKQGTERLAHDPSSSFSEKMASVKDT